MELLTYNDHYTEYTFYNTGTNRPVIHGEYKCWHCNGRLWQHLFYYHGALHGELKFYNNDGVVFSHCFYIKEQKHPYVKMNDQEKLLFQIQHPGFRFIED